ncbi:MAG: tetratricopeptide repeat protein, partial [Candidatus Dormibacteraceae bacterium]
LYIVESVRDEVDFARGWHLFHLKQYAEAAQTFEQMAARTDPSWKAHRSAILANLGSVYAQQGEVEQAAHTFCSAFRTAQEASAFRHMQRTKTMRQQWLGENDSPAVHRLDEEFLLSNRTREHH